MTSSIISSFSNRASLWWKSSFFKQPLIWVESLTCWLEWSLLKHLITCSNKYRTVHPIHQLKTIIRQTKQPFENYTRKHQASPSIHRFTHCKSNSQTIKQLWTSQAAWTSNLIQMFETIHMKKKRMITINQSTTQSIKQSNNKTNNQTINQSIKQSNKQTNKQTNKRLNSMKKLHHRFIINQATPSSIHQHVDESEGQSTRRSHLTSDLTIHSDDHFEDAGDWLNAHRYSR